MRHDVELVKPQVRVLVGILDAVWIDGHLATMKG